jgi:glycosyltransferase involved in cell wall biosynthesis
MSESGRLVVIQTHPVQYHVPVYRALVGQGIQVSALYGSDCSVVGYADRGFGRSFAWDRDLTSGYQAIFMGTTAEGSDSPEFASTEGLPERLQELQPDAVLVTGYSPAFYRRALDAAFAARLPVLIRAETTDRAQPRSWLKRQARTVFLRRLYRRCSALLYIGQRSRAHFQRLRVPESKLFFSPYTVDPTSFQADDLARARLRERQRLDFRIDAGSLVLLFSGKLIPRKAPLLLLEAVQALPEALRARVAVVFLGDGELQGEIERAAAGAGIRAIITGFVNQTRLSPYYHAADLLVVPSEWETWGLVVNDALHHGLPCVVSSTVDCHPDLISEGRTGHVFETRAPEHLARTLERAVALTDRADIRAVCRERAAQYSPEAAAHGIERALASLRTTSGGR